MRPDVMVLFLLIFIVFTFGFITARAKKTETGLLSAAQKGDIKAVRNLLAKGADMDIKNGSGMTPLMAAADNGYADIVKELLNYGADINAKDNAGTTALTRAEQKNYKEIIQILKQAGAKGQSHSNKNT